MTHPLCAEGIIKLNTQFLCHFAKKSYKISILIEEGNMIARDDMCDDAPTFFN